MGEELSDRARQYGEYPLPLNREEPEGKPELMFTASLFPPAPDPLKREEREWVRRKYLEEGRSPLSDSGYVLWLEEKITYLYGYIIDVMKQRGEETQV